MSGTDATVAIDTGAARGVGAAIAERWVLDGFRVAVDHSRAHGAREAAEVADRIGTSGGHADVRQADVGDPAEVETVFDDAEARLGGVDVVVSNAGITRLARIEDGGAALFDRRG